MAFVDQMRELIDKGLAASKEALIAAGDKAQQLGEKGVLKMEIVQLRSQIEKLTSRLGLEVYETLVDKGQKTVSKDTPAIAESLAKIQELANQKVQKETAYRNVGGKDEDLKTS